MYEAIAKSLRLCAEHGPCGKCFRYPGDGNDCTGIYGLALQAADAMDEMNRCLDGIEADNESLCKKVEELSKPIVRCRDCKHNGAHCPIQAAGFSVYAGSDIKPEKPFGCMYGERKENAE